MEEQSLDIVEFNENFTRGWLEQELRRHNMYGGLEKHLIPLRTEGYVLPRILERKVEGYLLHRYMQETGGVKPIQAQEIYYPQYSQVEVVCQGMYVPAERSEAKERELAVTN